MSRISRFSPNWSNPDELEAITVAREAFIASAVDSARESALTKNKHHRLFIGPRGSGKTHLITLIRHRLVKMNDLNDTLRIAWLNEDETSDTLLSLLLRAYRSLSREYPIEFPADLTEAVFDLEDTQEATLAITGLLLKQLQDKTILLLIENLDELFHTFGEAEQKSWRALMQNHPQFCTITTAQRLFRGISNHDAPFFGFFQMEYLKPFDSSEASELFTKIAELRKDEALKQFIGSPRGRARIRALHHLTGGNQRLFIILSKFIDRNSLDSLVEPFEELVDEQLTPYYQERLRWISPLQRRIVEYLCTIVKPEPVKAIARHLFSTSQTISKQLQELRKLGYVSSRSRGRESLYELAEPLMRLSYQVKEARGRSPLRLLVDFLRVWYDQQELLQRMQLVDREASVTQNYIHTILNSGQNRDVWERGVALLINTLAENSAITLLGTGLIESIEFLQSLNLSTEGLSAWYALWEEKAQQHPELELPVRLLRTAIDYIISGGDTTVLLDLPQEERRILTTALKLDA